MGLPIESLVVIQATTTEEVCPEELSVNLQFVFTGENRLLTGCIRKRDEILYKTEVSRVSRLSPRNA